MAKLWEQYGPPAPKKTFTASAPSATQETGGYEFGKEFVREEPEWYNFGIDPIFWLLEKINRPQQALFGYASATLKGESSYEAVSDAFLKGKRTEAFEILDLMGLKGQAGKFDPVEDTLGIAMELFVDPVNLVGVGPFAKLGKGIVKAADKVSDIAGFTSKSKAFMKTLDKLGGVEKLIEQGIVPPGDLGTRVLKSAEKMLGPDAYSHYINLGWGKFKTSIPGSNVFLEKTLIGPAKTARKWMKGFMSTIPESQDEAILKAMLDTSERVISGAEKNIANVRRLVGPDWAAKLSNAIELKDKAILKGAPDKVMEVYEDLKWFSEYAPQVEQLSGVMTKGLGEAAAEAARGTSKILDNYNINYSKSSLGAGKDKIDSFTLSLKKGTAHVIINDMGNGLWKVGGVSVGKGLRRQGVATELFRTAADEVHRLGGRLVGEVDGGEIFVDGKKLREGLRKKDFFGDDIPLYDKSGKLLGKAPEILPHPPAVVKGKSLAGKLDAHGLDDDISQLGYMLHAVTKEAKNYMYGNDIRSAAKKPRGWEGEFKPKHLSQLGREMPGDIATINERYGPNGVGKFTLHPKGELESIYLKRPDLRKAITDVARAFDGGLDKTSPRWAQIQTKLRKIGEAMGEKPLPEQISFEKWLERTPVKQDMLDYSRKMVDSHRFPDPLFASFQKSHQDIASALRKQWQNKMGGKKMTENEYKALWNSYLDSPNGQKWAKNLFKDASHRQKFDQFMEDDALKLLGARIGRHYRARVAAETISEMFKNPEWAVPIEKIPREYADNIAKGVGDLVDDIDNIPDGFRLLDIKNIEKSITPEFATRMRNTVVRNDMAVALEKGILGMFDVREGSKAMGWMRQAMGYVRASTILPIAGYHVANKAGNLWWRYVGGTANILNDIDAGKFFMASLKNDRQALSKMTFNLGKTKMTGIELRNALEQYDVATGGFLTEAAGGASLATGAEIGGKTRFIDQINPFSRKQFGGKVARLIEDQDRVAHFIGRLRVGDTIEEASKSVDTYLFRYSDLTEIEAGTKAAPGIRDTMMFYTWYRKNLGLTLQKMWEYPGRLSMPIKIRHAFDDVFGDPESEYATPAYMRDSFFLYLGKDKEGMPRFLDPEKYLPPLSAAKFPAGGLKGIGQQLGSMFVPPLKAPLEMALDKEFFSGRNIEGVPGQVKSIFGKEVTPLMDYAVRNLRILNVLNRMLFPTYEQPDGTRLGAGEPGKRPGLAYGKARQREWGGIRSTTTDPQRTRYMEGISENGRIGDALNKIGSKLNNPDISDSQRNSYMNERTKLLWEKAEILGEMIEDGTDPFTGETMEWVAEKAVQGEEDKGSMRQIYKELQSTLRGLYFGNVAGPLDHGIITIEQKPRLSAEESKYVYEMFEKVTTDMFKKNTDYAMEHKDGDYYRTNVLDQIRDMIRTEDYYSPTRIRKRKGNLPKSDIVLYDYPYEFRKALADSYKGLLLTGVHSKLIKRDSFGGMWKRFRRDYGVDYD